jgi:hypothetical protein
MSGFADVRMCEWVDKEMIEKIKRTMKASLKIFFLIFIPLTIFSQTTLLPPHSPTEDGIKRNNYNRACTFKYKFSSEERKKNYPFNIAANIKLVSFYCKEDGICGMPGKKGLIDESKFLESRILDSSQVNTLTHILFNYGYVGEFDFETSSLCWEPRNAILFLDQKGKIIEYLALCFHCKNYEASNPKIQIGEECLGKYDLLAGLFWRAGIKYGSGKK